MVDFYTYSIYLFVLLWCVVFSYTAYYNRVVCKVKPFQYFFLFLSFIVLVIISGLRDFVGTDYNNYYNFYEFQSYNEEEVGVRLEIGFKTIIDLLKRIDLGPWTLFTTSAILIWSLFFISFKNFKKHLYLGLFFAITYNFFFFSFNGIRQAIAMAALGFAFKYIEDKKMIKYFIFIFLTSTIHYSIIIFLPFYFFISKIHFKQFVWYVLFFVSLLLHFISASLLVVPLYTLNNWLSFIGIEYGNYISSFENSIKTLDSSKISLGYIVYVIIGFFILMYYKEIVAKEKKYLPYFNLSLIGIVFYNAFANILIIARVNSYFIFFQIFCLTFIIKHLLESKNKIIAYLILLFFVFIFIYNISVNSNGCNPYQFISF